MDDIQVAGALQLGEGWMHIHGRRLLGETLFGQLAQLTPTLRNIM